METIVVLFEGFLYFKFKVLEFFFITLSEVFLKEDKNINVLIIYPQKIMIYLKFQIRNTECDMREAYPVEGKMVSKRFQGRHIFQALFSLSSKLPHIPLNQTIN